MSHLMRFILAAIIIAAASPLRGDELSITVPPNASPRIQYGASRLKGALAGVSDSNQRIIIELAPRQAPESYKLQSRPDHTLHVIGADDSGALYGCLELSNRIRSSKGIPENLNLSDSPAFKLRGPCIGMQKTYILPGRKVYEYPYTPDLFPFFYDKAFWTEYLDFLADNRFNTLYLWNGHPFSSLVRVPDYPDCIEVPEDIFQKNVEMYHWIASECDKRGIWLVQMFYNILIPKPLAEKHNLDTQLSAPNEIASDYTRKAIAEFIKEYPNVGLMICLGEALRGTDNQKQWLCETLLPATKDGMKLAGLKSEPPVVLRTHATDLRLYMADALKIYKNIYTEAKYNGESLTTHEPRGARQQVHLAMSQLGSTHLINVHILANLEPFRYGDQRFIQKCVQAGRDRLGARGLHLYPLFYWNWPDSPDRTDPPLKQWRRDWIWFEAWARYSWNPDIDEKTDHAYWISRLAKMYGPGAAEDILAAYNDSGECAPRLLRRFGITEGNRQTFSLGMTLDQLVRPEKYGAFTELWESQSPPGERLAEYVDKEWNHQKHEGETPPQIIAESLEFSAKAVSEIDAAASAVTNNRDEFFRLQNDILCIRALTQNYAAKANAAILVLRYQDSHDIADMEKAVPLLSQSLDHFRQLTDLTRDTYLYANSCQTGQRKIPVTGAIKGQPANYHWTQLLPVYEKELADFQAKVAALKSAKPNEP